MQTLMADDRDMVHFANNLNASPAFKLSDQPPNKVSNLDIKALKDGRIGTTNKDQKNSLGSNDESADFSGTDAKAYKSGGFRDQNKEKNFQAQLEMSQFKLHDLARKIDECLSASKVNYTDSKVMQPSVSSLSKSSINEIVETPSVIEAKPEPRPDNRNEKSSFSRNNSDGASLAGNSKLELRPESRNEKSAFSKNASERTPITPEAKSEPISSVRNEKPIFDKKTPEKEQKANLIPKNTSLKKTIETPHEVKSARQIKMNTEPKKASEKSVQKDAKPVTKPKASNKCAAKNLPKGKSDMKKVPGSTSDFQKQFETVSSVTVDTLDDVSKQKETYIFSPTNEDLANKGRDIITNKQFKGEGKNFSEAATSVQALEINKVTDQAKTQVQDSRFSFSNSMEVANNLRKQPFNETGKRAAQFGLDHNNELSQNTDSEEKMKYELDAVQISKQTFNSNPDADKGDEGNKEISNQLTAVQSFSPQKKKALKLNMAPDDEVQKKKQSASVMKSKVPSENSYKKAAPDFEFNADDRLDITNAISPVLNERRSSRGARDSFTPGYNFDATNLSMNDLKNLSFDSGLLGKDFSVKDQERGRERSGVSYSNDPAKNLDDSKRNNSKVYALSQGRNDKSYFDDDLETSFTKAYTVRKNKIIKDVSKFEERMESDIYFRRRFQDDLQKFLDEYKPKLSEEQAELLIVRLVEDSKRREIRTHKVQLQNEKSFRTTQDGFNGVSEDQLNQTFERLAADARKRMFVYEEKEKLKQIRDYEEEERAAQEIPAIKMSKRAEENLVIKLTEDAERRRLKFEKLQRAKIEEEIRQANDLLKQGFRIKNNRAKSKVREYIENNTQPKTPGRESRTPGRERKTANRVERGMRGQLSKSFHAEDRSLKTTRELMTLNDEDILSSTDHKFAVPKSRYLNIASPSKKVQRNGSPKSGRRRSPKGQSMSSLEYLKNLRKDIDKYKNNIEEHIQTIKSIDSSSVLQNNPQNTSKSQNQIQKASISDLDSPKAKSRNGFKVSSKYKSVQSKVAQHIEGKLTDQTQVKSPRDIKVRESNETPNNRGSYKANISQKSTATPKNREVNTAKPKNNESEDLERKSRTQSKFMNDKSAINFVEKLINDFKLSNK